MRCGHAERLISLELDQPLPPEQAERLAAHLARCVRCQAVRQSLRRAEGLLGTRSLSNPEPDLAARVLERLPHGRRAVIPPAPAWTRASGIVVGALLLLLLGFGGVMLGTGAALGHEAWPLVQESARSAIAAGLDSARELASALGAAAAALWPALRWPWAPIGGGIALLIGVVWGWLWVRSGRRRS